VIADSASFRLLERSRKQGCPHAPASLHHAVGEKTDPAEFTRSAGFSG
jgi:hypothetical protein